VPLFADLDTKEIDYLFSGFRSFTIAPGAMLMEQGKSADGVYFLSSGRADIVKRLPGGRETLINNVGPGAMLGEMALIRSAPRTASVRATTELTGIFLDGRYFEAMLCQLHPAAIKVLRRVTVILCERLRALHKTIIGQRGPGPALPLSTRERPASLATPLEGPACSFDFKAFVPVLQCFQRFDRTELVWLIQRTRALELKKGDVLFNEGDPPTACFVVVRGAAALVAIRGSRRHEIEVLGPGQLCGVSTMIDGLPHDTSGVAREELLVLEIDRPLFEDLVSGRVAPSLPFLNALCDSLANALLRAGNHVARLDGLSQLRAAAAAMCKRPSVRTTRSGPAGGRAREVGEDTPGMADGDLT
jgi:CRP-like cAMP-binding protein